jgi:hypothetical protein
MNQHVPDSRHRCQMIAPNVISGSLTQWHKKNKFLCLARHFPAARMYDAKFHVEQRILIVRNVVMNSFASSHEVLCATLRVHAFIVLIVVYVNQLFLPQAI